MSDVLEIWVIWWPKEMSSNTWKPHAVWRVSCLRCDNEYECDWTRVFESTISDYSLQFSKKSKFTAKTTANKDGFFSSFGMEVERKSKGCTFFPVLLDRRRCAPPHSQFPLLHTESELWFWGCSHAKFWRNYNNTAFLNGFSPLKVWGYYAFGVSAILKKTGGVYFLGLLINIFRPWCFPGPGDGTPRKSVLLSDACNIR